MQANVAKISNPLLISKLDIEKEPLFTASDA
jgi:hypothetical protein